MGRCTVLVRDMLSHLQTRYGNSLSTLGSGKRIKDIFKCIEWRAKETERIRQLRESLREGVQRLTLLTTLAAR